MIEAAADWEPAFAEWLKPFLEALGSQTKRVAISSASAPSSMGASPMTPSTVMPVEPTSR